MDKELINQEKSFVAMCKFLLWLFTALFITFIGLSGVCADTITDYATKYYYGHANDTTNNETAYKTGTDNRLTLFTGTAPTYADAETFTGFYNRINYSLVKGTKYNLTLKVSMSNLYETEFGVNNVNNRLLNIDFAHCSFCALQGVSGSIRKYNASAPIANNLYDYVVTVIYSFIATENTNQFYLGSYSGDDRTMGVYNHQYTSVIMVTDLTIDSDNSSTIINQNDTIINQNNEIINQNNENTQDIINNQNQNTQQQIESQKVCSFIDKQNIAEYGKYLNSSGVVSSTTEPFGITDYIHIDNNSTLERVSNGTAIYSASLCFYNVNKTLISCRTNSSITSTIDIPNDSNYVRFSINYNQNQPQYKLCRNGNQALNDSIEEQNQTSKGILGKIGDLFDTLFSNDNADVSGLNNMVGWLPPGPVDSIINLPLAFFNSLTNTLTGTCQSVSIPIPFVDDILILPCFDAYMSQYLTGFNTLWTLVGTILSVFILYYYLLSLYKWVDDTLTFRENNLPGYYGDNWGGGA